MPGSIGRPIGTRKDYGIAVRIPHPAFPMIRAAVSIGRILVPGSHNLDLHFTGALQGCVKIINLKPEQHAVSIWFVVSIADGTVIVLHFEAVQLKNKLALGDQLFVCGASMIAAAAEQTLVPAAACFYIRDGDKGLGTHVGSVSLASRCDSRKGCADDFVRHQFGCQQPLEYQSLGQGVEDAH